MRKVRNLTSINKAERSFVFGRLFVSLRLATVTSLHKITHNAVYGLLLVPVQKATYQPKVKLKLQTSLSLFSHSCVDRIAELSNRHLKLLQGSRLR
jgi:hypothetical protein